MIFGRIFMANLALSMGKFMGTLSVGPMAVTFVSLCGLGFSHRERLSDTPHGRLPHLIAIKIGFNGSMEPINSHICQLYYSKGISANWQMVGDYKVLHNL